jgi:hypothetical protein
MGDVNERKPSDASSPAPAEHIGHAVAALTLCPWAYEFTRFDSLGYMQKTKPLVYDRALANFLCAASTWVYSSREAFIDMLRRAGFFRSNSKANVVSIELSNDPLFLDTTAYVVQSGSLIIICFRGTQPRNIMNWLLDASTEKDRSTSSGYVHGGFSRGIETLWPRMRWLLGAAELGANICEAEKCDADLLKSCPAPELSGIYECGKEKAPDAIYITGHSLGGALAALAAVKLCRDQTLAPMLRGVYTFGQPMVGDKAFAEESEKEFGDKLFRHVYQRDVVPQLPPITVGRFEHFGRQYIWTPTGWMYSSERPGQALSIVVSTVIGTMAWAFQQVPLLRGVQLPFSWGDHSPRNYLRTSEMTPNPTG